jgi:hypothetical protein
MTEYSNEWLLAKAKASRDLLQQLPQEMQGNLVLASAVLPTAPSLTERVAEAKAAEVTQKAEAAAE